MQKKRLIARALSVLALVASSLGVTAVANAPSAGAICQGTALNLDLYSGGVLRAREAVQYTSTCDGDRIYKGKVHDSSTDGQCAYARFYDAGQWFTQGISCTTGSWVNYTFFDQNGNSSSTFLLDVIYTNSGNWAHYGY